MGVRACNKLGCTNIMCDRSSDIGYICSECFDKLVNSFSGSNEYDEEEIYDFWDNIFPETDRDYGHHSNWS
jgi:hypothetical protein